MRITKRGCKCGKSFYAKVSDVKRGWGNSCSKSCAAQRRELKKRLGYKKQKISEIVYDRDYFCKELK